MVIVSKNGSLNVDQFYQNFIVWSSTAVCCDQKSHAFKWDPLADEVLEAALSSPTEKRRPPTCPI